MKKTIRIINRVYQARFAKDINQPYLGILFSHLGSLCFYFLHVFSFKLVISRFSFSGWPESHMWVLLSVFQIFTYTCFYIFWRGFVHTARDIRSGNFDFFVSKPVSSRVYTFLRGGSLHNLTCIILGILNLFGVLVYYHISIDPISVLMFLISLVSSIILFFNLTSAYVALNFRYGNLSDSTLPLFLTQEAYKFPSHIYGNSINLASFFLIMLSSMVTLPASLLLSKSMDSMQLVIYWLVFFASFVISDFAWSRGVRHYSSASS